MERVLSESEKLRRAEEIYFRRNNKDVKFRKNGETKEEKSSISKYMFDFLLMLNIIVIVFCVQNKEFVFTQAFLEKCETYNININEEISKLVGQILQENDGKNVNEITNDVQIETPINEENMVSVPNQEVVENNIEENKEQVSEELRDIENLKQSYSFISPLNATVTSRFGNRMSTNKNVSSYHTGIDLGAENGTDIVASTEGIVELVSNGGDYGKHVKIRLNNVTTLYAHCSKIFVKEGQIVAQGQRIAKVGSTGNSTGNHLHFEIRIDDRYINPDKIISF